jgi:hypothetical protein
VIEPTPTQINAAIRAIPDHMDLRRFYPEGAGHCTCGRTFDDAATFRYHIAYETLRAVINTPEPPPGTCAACTHPEHGRLLDGTGTVCQAETTPGVTCACPGE